VKLLAEGNRVFTNLYRPFSMIQYREGRANLIGLVIDSLQYSDADLDECISWFRVVITKRLPKLLGGPGYASLAIGS